MATNPHEIVDAEYSDSQEIVPRVEVALSIEREPRLVLEEAHRAAKVLQEVIESKKNKVQFNGTTYLTFEDWQTVARFYGVAAKVVSTSYVEYGEVKGFDARAVAVLASNGVEVSGAEAMCMNDEQNWKKKPMFQLKSMAQTRACAKALRNILAFVPVLAGYAPTPAEEMIERGSQEAADSVGAKRLAEMKDRVAKQETAKNAPLGAQSIKVHSYPEDVLGDVELSGLGCKTAGLKRQSASDPTRYLMAYEKMYVLRDKCKNLGITLEEPSA